MKDMMGRIWRITKKDFRAAVNDPKGVWSWSADAGFVVSVVGVLEEMSTQFLFKNDNLSRFQWYHWHRANIINKGDPVAKDIEIRVNVKMVRSWEAKVSVE